MPTLAPGTYIQESSFPSFSATALPSGAFVFIGAHNRGSLALQLIPNWSAFVTQYGGFTGNTVPSGLALAVYTFFNNGGGSCYVLRIVASATDTTPAVIAAQTLNGAGAVATLKVQARNPGIWGNNIYVIAGAGSTTSTFSLSVYYGGTANAQLAEPVWQNLSMNPGDSRYAPSLLNNPLNGSNFITLTDLAAAPLTTPGPVPIAATAQLGVGTGSVPGVDGGVLTSTDLLGCQTQLNLLANPLTINFPGVTDTTVLTPMITYCNTGRSFADSILVIDPPSGQTAASAISYFGTVGANSHAVGYFPWVTVSDPSSSSPQALRTLPPGAFAMSQWAVTDATRGVQKAPAGFTTTLNALAPETYLSETDIGNLTGANINAIRFLPGAGIVLWGARTLSNVQSTLYLNVRRTLIYIETQMKALVSFAPFEDNNPFLWNRISVTLVSFLTKFWSSGGLANATQANAFFVVCDSTNNVTNSSTVNVTVGVAVAAPAEFIVISIGQWAGGTTLVEASTAPLGL